MRLNYLVIIFLILFSAVIAAQESTIYGTINAIKSNPRQYTIVIGSSTDSDEIKAASELAGVLGVTNSRFDAEVKTSTNLVIIGNPSVNSLTESMLGKWAYGEGKAVIKVVSNNLIIAGSTTKDTQKAVDIIKEHEKNKRALQGVEYITGGMLFSPKNPVFLIPAVIVLIIIVSVIVLVTVKIKESIALHRHAAQEQPVQRLAGAKPSPEKQRLVVYIQTNLAKGYTKDELRKVLLKAGWDAGLVNSAFKKL